MDVPLEILDQEVASAAAALARARRDPLGDPDPLAAHRRVSTRATYLELADAKGPLAAPLRAWVGSLTLERVLAADAARLAEAWRAHTIQVEEPGVSAFVASPRDLLLRVLGDADPARARIFADALARGAAPASDAARALAERRAEATRLLGADADALEIPIEPPAALAPIAERLLADTAALSDAPRGSWHEALTWSVARDAGQGWPARQSPRWLFDLFHGGPLVEGLRLELAPLPAALGATSFARALAAFGAALADADGPRGALFVPAHAPEHRDVRRARRAALFGALAADPVFGARALGLGRGAARDQARRLARALLLGLRLDAARVLCRGILSRPNGPWAALFEERTAAALGAPLPPALAGVVPRLGPGDPARFAGALLGMSDRRALVERFDEDWFRSPHAARAIREEDAALPGSHFLPAAAIEGGLAELLRALADFG